MPKSNHNNGTIKRLIWILISVISVIALIIKFYNNSNATDLQKLLQNLPNEITQSINSANSKQNSDNEIILKFEKLTEEIKKKQDLQVKQFEKQRRVLEKKIKDLKQLPNDATLREKLSYSFEYDSTRKFPAFIWQTWVNDAKPEELLANKADWEDKNPGFVHEVLSDDVAEALIRHYYASIPEVLEAYNALPTKILKIDFFKYLILLARGGVYADMDTVPLQPIPNWIPETIDPTKVGLIIGIEHDAQNKNWKSDFVRRLQFGTWVIQAKAGHPIIREIVAEITEITLERKADNNLNMNFRNDLTIMGWTGSGVWTDVIFTYFNDYMRSGVPSKTTWKDFHNLKVPKLLSDILVFPEFSFKAPNEILNDDPNSSLYFTTHDSLKFWKTIQNVA